MVLAHQAIVPLINTVVFRSSYSSIGPATLDVHLSNNVLVPRPTRKYSDMTTRLYSGVERNEEMLYADGSADDTSMFPIDLMDSSVTQIILAPGNMMLGSTKELFAIPPWLIARVDGKSSIGRLGVAVHVTAGIIDPGFGWSDNPAKSANPITLEIVNHNLRPVVFTYGQAVAQVEFSFLDGIDAGRVQTDKPYNGRYALSTTSGPTVSRKENGR